VFIPVSRDHLDPVLVAGQGDVVAANLTITRSTCVEAQLLPSLVALNERLRERKLAPVNLREAPERFETEDMLEMVNAGLVPIVVRTTIWRVLASRLSQSDPARRPGRADGRRHRVRDSEEQPELKAELDALR